MPKAEKSLFGPKSFLAKVGEGKAILKFKKNQIVFAQGDVASKVFYIQREGSRFSSSLNRVRKQLSGYWNLGSSLVKDASMAIPCGFR